MIIEDENKKGFCCIYIDKVFGEDLESFLELFACMGGVIDLGEALGSSF